MADKKKTPGSNKASDTKVTRIKAKDTTPAEIAQTPPKKTKIATRDESKRQRKSKTSDDRRTNLFVAMGRYFKGAWEELKQVRWPTRRATWKLTGAVLAFTAFFVVVILLLDAAFKYLFELILQ